MFTLEQLKKIMPNCKEPDKWLTYLVISCNEYEINNPERVAAFLAQIAVESGELNRVIENLNYSRERLLKVFPKHFNAKNVDSYARIPAKIANKVYSNRIGNGDEASGDGWRYRGRGLIQITGKDNYRDTQEKTGIQCLNTPEILETKQYAAMSAAYFFARKAKGNSLADDDTPESFIRLTKNINGGTHGLEERIKYWNTAKTVLRDS